MDGLDFQEIYKSKVENLFTLGAEYYGKKYVSAVMKVNSLDKKMPLGDMWTLMTDGDHGSPDYQDDGVLYLLSESVQEGYIDKSKCRFITKEKNEELKRSCLHPRDIVITKTGAYYGKSAVIPQSIPEANTIAHVGKLTLKEGYNPYYVSTFLNCKYGYYQLRRRGIKATRPEIKLVEFPDIIIPIFSEEFEMAIEDVICSAEKKRSLSSQKIDIAGRTLLEELECRGDFSSVSIRSFSGSFAADGRLDAEYYHPKYDEYDRAVCNYKHGYSIVRDKFEPIKTKCARDLEEYCYVEIGDINIGDGSASYNVIETEDLPDNAKILTRRGDVLVSTVRPNRGAVAILEEDNLLVSGAFTVLRQKEDYPKEVLQVLFRTELYRDWLLRYNGGTSYPVIKDEDVLNMPIPLFDVTTCGQIIQLVKESGELRRQSDSLLVFAKQAVEMAVEQDEDVALMWLKDKMARLEV